MKRNTSLILILPIILFCLCSKSGQWKGNITEENGVVVVHNPEEGLWKNSKRMVLEEMFRIGEEEGDSAYLLAKIWDIAVNQKGDIYICDLKDNCIKVFNSNGIYIRTIGKKGQGPGELYLPSEMSLDSESNLYVYDAGNNRICIFNCQGIFMDSFRYNLPKLHRVDKKIERFISPYIFDMHIGSDHTILLSVWLPPSKVTEDFENYPLIFQLNKKGETIKSFGKQMITGKTDINIHFSWSTMVLKGNKIICTVSYPYKIIIFNSSGKLEMGILKDDRIFEGYKVLNDSEIMSYSYDYQSVNTQGSISYPLVLPDGKIMVEVTDNGENYIEDQKNFLMARAKGKFYDSSQNIKFYYDLFDSEGRFLQRFPSNPGQGSIRYIDLDGFAYAVKSDEFPQVIKYKIYFEDI
jgi:hypothetical protein